MAGSLLTTPSHLLLPGQEGAIDLLAVKGGQTRMEEQ